MTQDLANELAALSQIVQFFVEKNPANNVPDVLMSSGIFRDFVQLFSKFKHQVRNTMEHAKSTGIN